MHWCQKWSHPGCQMFYIGLYRKTKKNLVWIHKTQSLDIWYVCSIAEWTSSLFKLCPLGQKFPLPMVTCFIYRLKINIKKSCQLPHSGTLAKLVRVQRSGIDTIKHHTWPRIPMGKWQTHSYTRSKFVQLVILLKMVRFWGSQVLRALKLKTWKEKVFLSKALDTGM